MKVEAAERPLGERGPQGMSRALMVALAALALLTLIYAAWPIWRAFLPLEIDLNEPWNAYHADAFLAGRSLYPPPTGFIINNYPPLSFYVIGAIATVGDPLYVGRFLSLAAILATALAVFSIARQFGASRTAGLVGALWYCATMARFLDKYAGMNDPNLPGLALMMLALAWLVHLRVRGRAAEPAILLMVVAGFYKHNLFAVPVTAICWLSLGDMRVAIRAALVGAAAAAAGLALCGLAYGSVFFESLLMGRQYSLAIALGALGRLQWIAPALVIFVIWAWHQRHSEAARFSSLLVAAAFVFHFLQKLGAGVDDNAQFELIAATAVGLALAFASIDAVPLARRFGVERSRLVIILILIVRLLASGRVAPYLLLVSPEFHADMRARTALVASEVARIASIPGPVICSVQSVCRAAGKPFLYDPFFVWQRIVTGKTTQSDVDQTLRTRGYRNEAVAPRTVADWR